MCPTPKKELDVSNPDNENNNNTRCVGSLEQNPPRYLCHCNAHEPCPTFHLREVEFFFCALPGFQMMVGYTLLMPDGFLVFIYIYMVYTFGG